MPGMIEWLIIGGGIHGTYLANLLTHLPGTDAGQVRIVDPQAALLATWRRNTANCGMAFLRSPATHNIDLPILSLYHFAKTPQGRTHAAFIPPYNRPSLALFQHHCRRVIEANRLEGLHVRARATGVQSDGRTLVVETDGPTLRTRRLLLAIGLGEQPCWPAWALRLKSAGARLAHVFDPGFKRREWRQASRTVVIGGGITAVQTALQLHAESRGQVHLLSRHALRERQYDFDPCWIGPKCLRAFYRTGFRRRREAIDNARISGSLPIEVLETFTRALNDARLSFSEGQCTDATPIPGGGVRLETSAGPLAADQAILATGFETRRPGGALVDRLIRDFRLQCNPCGYPIVAPDLRWADRIYASGPLAELQLGPCARNIVGARNAGRLLLQGLGIDSRALAGG
jgi:hypothetical protein